MAYNKAQIDRIGNAIIYLSENIKQVSKTKLLKLLYILEEESLKKSGVQFTDLNYQIWPKGPVAFFVEKQIKKRRDTLGEFFDVKQVGQGEYIVPKKSFSDEEFSKFDIDLLDNVILRFGKCTAEELIDYTHRDGSIWKKITDKFGDTPPVEHKEIDLLQVLDEPGVSDDVKTAAKEHKAFLDFLKNR